MVVRDYCVYGFSNPEERFTWTNGQKSGMKFVFQDEVKSDLCIKLNYFVYTDTQHVLVYGNGKLIEEYDAVGEEEKDIVIPY